MPTGLRKQAASDLAAFLRALHSTPVAVGLGCGLTRLNAVESAQSLRKQAARMVYPLLDDKDRRQLDAFLARRSTSPDGLSDASVLLHCDIAPGHLLVDPLSGRLTGIIDFGDAAIGEAARDFIFIYEDFGTEVLDEVLAFYAGTDAASLLSEVRKWHLLDILSWTIKMIRAGRASDVSQGLEGIIREQATSKVRRGTGSTL